MKRAQRAFTQKEHTEDIMQDIRGLSVWDAVKKVTELKDDFNLYVKEGWAPDDIFTAKGWRDNVNNRLKVLFSIGSKLTDAIGVKDNVKDVEGLK
jgi:hypothetical protein